MLKNKTEALLLKIYKILLSAVLTLGTVETNTVNINIQLKYMIKKLLI